MKYLLLVLLFIGTIQLNAGSVTDNANVLGSRLYELNEQVAALPIFIESHEHLDDPRAYADSKVKQLTNKGFLIVVTTNPRKWRISMTPDRVVSGEETRIIGDKMMPYFKKADYYSGFLMAATELNCLLGKAVIVEQERHELIITPKNKSDDVYMTIFLVTIIIGGLIIISYGIYKWVNKPIALTPEIKQKPLYGQIESDENLPKFTNNWGAQTGLFKSPENQPIFVTGEYFAPVSGEIKKSAKKQYYVPPSRTSSSSHHYHDSGPDLITPLVVYSALNNNSHSSSSDDRPKSTPSTDYSSYSSSDSSSSYDSSSSSSDSGGSSGGDW